MKNIALLILMFLSFSSLKAQEIYNPKADALKDIQEAIKQANTEGKHVLIQVGGNWCGWCRRMEKLFETDAEMKSILDQNYVRVHLNYSKENKNEEVLSKLGNPNRFGFPVLVVLDGNGSRLHTQNTAYLENCSGEAGYENKKISDFLKSWTKSSI